MKFNLTLTSPVGPVFPNIKLGKQAHYLKGRDNLRIAEKMYLQAVSKFQMRCRTHLRRHRAVPLSVALGKVLKELPAKKMNRVVWQIPGHSQCLPFTVGEKGRHKSYLEN
ncbi:MAG: hypothetical protein WBM69_10445 [Desulfobacterales bacterium]